MSSARRGGRPRSLSLLFAWGVGLAGCGGSAAQGGVETSPGNGEPTTLPGEHERGRLRGTRPVRADDLVASDWRYREGTCTEGILDMSVRGFAETLRVHEVPGGLVFVADRVFEEDGCAQTVTLHAQRGTAETPDTRWFFREHARVSYPDSPRCERVAQEDARGDIRMRGERLELYLRRSPWCGGYEARLVYDAVPRASTADASTTLRRFVAAFHDRDSLALADLYAASGAHHDPQRPDETGSPTSHVGRAAVQSYFASVFQQTPWLAMRLVHVDTPEERVGTEGARTLHLQARVQYMDPRLDAPREGSLELHLVEGRIFESRLRIHEPALAGQAEPAAVP